MNIQFASAETTFCPKLKTREGHEAHIFQPHLPISSLPGPGERLEISQFPITIRSDSPKFSPQNIANLWLQLLVIQIQNGNFWEYDDVVKLCTEKAPVRTVPPKTTNPNPNPQTHLDVINDPKPKILDEKSVLFLRHKLQKGFLSRDKSPTAADVAELSKYIEKFENAPELEPNVIKSVKIHKVLIAICKLDPIPGDEEFNIRGRCEALITCWRRVPWNHTPAEKAERAAKLAAEANPGPPQVVLEPAETPAVVADDGNQTPPVCVTQLTPDQCAHIEALAQVCEPPLDRAVVELMCTLPQFSSKLEREVYQIGPLARIHDTADRLQHNPGFERKFEGWGPAIPAHVLQLTQFSEESYGTALYVDTKTGEGIVFSEYRVIDPEELDVKWEHLVGKRKPIEEILQEWIDSFLKGTFLPSGGGAVWEEGPRSIAHRRMDFLRHKTLLHEFGWPESFPLQAPQYYEFLRCQHDLHKITFDNNPRHTVSLSRKWNNAVSECYPRGNFVLDTKDTHKRELLSTLNNRVRQALEYQQCRIEERQYALAADLPMQQDLMQPLSLHASANIGDDWRVDISPEMIIERFEEVFARSPQAKDADTEKMREILQRAYERQKKSEQGVYERDYWDEEDDDSTSDFDPEDEDVEEGEDEYESDEDMEDLDVGVLKKDMEDDVEIVRVRLEGYRIRSV